MRILIKKENYFTYIVEKCCLQVCDKKNGIE